MLKLLITRYLPECAIEKARSEFDVTYRDSPDVMSHDEMVQS